MRAVRSLVLVAEPGAGKTTRVPPALLRGGVLSADNPAVVVLQPRRVAARAVASRIADENGWPLGGTVGYHVRFDRRIGPDTVLRVVTEGILTRQLLDDPFLDGVGAVVLDEFHERSLYTDVAIALLREVQQTVRPDLAIVVMSATLEAGPVAAYLGGCPVVRVPGRTYPVTISYEPDEGASLAARVAAAIERSPDDGDVLAFLPGAEEIRRCGAALDGVASKRNWSVLPLYGALSPAEQNAALRPSGLGRRRVVLATNIAETSLTIDGVRNRGRRRVRRVASYDPGGVWTAGPAAGQPGGGRPAGRPGGPHGRRAVRAGVARAGEVGPVRPAGRPPGRPGRDRPVAPRLGQAGRAAVRVVRAADRGGRGAAPSGCWTCSGRWRTGS